MRKSPGNRDAQTPPCRPLLTRNEAGALSLPLALLLGAVFLGATGLIGALTLHRRAVALQLRLDTCAGKEAQAMVDAIRAVEAANSRMKVERIAAAALLVIAPAAAEALRNALILEAGIQDARILIWRGRQVKWLAGRGCGTGAVPLPLASPPWERPPPDLWGPRPLLWTGPKERRFHVELRHKRRGVAAQVEDRSADRSKGTKEGWHASWTRRRIHWSW